MSLRKCRVCFTSKLYLFHGHKEFFIVKYITPSRVRVVDSRGTFYIFNADDILFDEGKDIAQEYIEAPQDCMS